MRRTVIALALAAVVAGGGPAWAQRYEALTSDSERLQQLVDEIRDLIDEVERARAADARFVRDVRAVLGRYDNPWRVPLVAEDFRDGDFTRNPAWAVHGGEYFVSLRDGLHSRADASRLALTPPRPRRTQESPRDTAADILGRIISEALREDEEDAAGATAPAARPPPPAARINLPLRLTGAFELAAEFKAADPRAALELAVYRGAADADGYRVVLTPGTGIDLVRQLGRDVEILQSFPDTGLLARGRTHTIQWTRGADGLIVLRLDGVAVVQVADRPFFDTFDGFSLGNRGGEYVLRSLTINGTAARR